LPPAAGGGGDKKFTADEWLAEELKNQGKQVKPFALDVKHKL